VAPNAASANDGLEQYNSLWLSFLFQRGKYGHRCYFRHLAVVSAESLHLGPGIVHGLSDILRSNDVSSVCGAPRAVREAVVGLIQGSSMD